MNLSEPDKARGFRSSTKMLDELWFVSKELVNQVFDIHNVMTLNHSYQQGITGKRSDKKLNFIIPTIRVIWINTPTAAYRRYGNNQWFKFVTHPLFDSPIEGIHFGIKKL